MPRTSTTSLGKTVLRTKETNKPSVSSRTCRMLLGAACILAVTMCQTEIGYKTMKDKRLSQIHSCNHLIGFWQLSVSSGHYLAILQRNAEETQSTLSVMLLIGNEWQLLKTITNEDVGIQAIDGYLIGTDLFFCMEINGYEALQIARSELRTFIDPKLKEVPFILLGDVSPTIGQSQKVELSVSHLWHSATPLAPIRWVFSPRFVRGDIQFPEVIANTADGQAMLFSHSGSEDERAAFAIQDAAEPQAYIYGGQQYVVFKRYTESYYPFWALPRYSGDLLPRSGNLMLTTEGELLRNLTAELGIGPILDFVLVKERDGPVWIFALRDAPVGTDVVAMMQRGMKVVVEAKWSLDEEFEKLSVEHGGDQWHLVYKMRTEDGWSLHYQDWQLNR